MVTLESSQRSPSRSRRASALFVYNGSYTDRTTVLCELREAFPSVSQGYRKAPVLERIGCNLFSLDSDIAGIRTLSVFTKYDMMDEGTNNVEIAGIMYNEDKTVDDLEDEIDHCGRAFSDDTAVRMYTILKLCYHFERTFKEHLDGRCSGGAQIYGIVECHLPIALKKLPFDQHLSLQNVKKVAFEADGYLPHLIAPEQAYRRLIESGITYFRGPAEASVDRVHFVLEEIVRMSIAEVEDLKRFPALQAEIIEAALEALRRYREDTKKTALQLVDMESSYITLDFFRKIPQEVVNGGIPAAMSGDEYLDVHYRRIRLLVSFYLKMVSETLRRAIPKAIVHCQVREARTSLLDRFYNQIRRKKVPYNHIATGNELAWLLDEDITFIGQRQECLRNGGSYRSSRDEIALAS